MASTRRKSAAIAIAIVGIAGLSLAAAAQLNVNASSLGAGTDLVASCDNAVDVDFTNSVVSGAYVVSSVTVSGIAEACEGLTIGITVEGQTPAEKVIAEDQTSVSFTLSPAVAANLLEDVAVIIYEPAV